MTYLLDTCIVSRLRKIKSNPHEKLISWVEKHSESAYFISVLTLGEIQKGISKLSPQEAYKKMVLEDWLMSELIPRFVNRTLPVDATTASIWGDLCGKNKKENITLPVIDSLLAATAMQHHLILVTENTKDFLPTGVRLLNPLL